jgi:hypothetical protein
VEEVADVRAEPYSRLTVEVELNRRSGFYLLKVALPLFFIVALTWSVFWMKDEPLAGRIRISSTGVLTIVAYQFAISNDLPRVSYLTLMDRAMIVSFMLITVTVLESMLVFRYRERGDEARALQIDRTSRWAFPALYVALLAATGFVPHIV